MSISSHATLLTAEEDSGKDRNATEYNHHWEKEMAELRKGVKFGVWISTQDGQLGDFTAMEILVYSSEGSLNQRIVKKPSSPPPRVSIEKKSLYPLDEILHKEIILSTKHVVPAPTLQRILGQTDERGTENAT